LTKIAQEATEQSRWRTLPSIEFIKDISQITKDQTTKIIIFDKSNSDIKSEDSNSNTNIKNILGIVWPEGWLTSKDYENFGNNYEIQQLWNTILRTETASIIAGWQIKKID
jgi:RsmE family RNA methyltransferase